MTRWRQGENVTAMRTLMHAARACAAAGLIGLAWNVSATAGERADTHARQRTECATAAPWKHAKSQAAKRPNGVAARRRQHGAPLATRRLAARYRLHKDSRPDVQQVPCDAVLRRARLPYELAPIDDGMRTKCTTWPSAGRHCDPGSARRSRAGNADWLFETPDADGTSSYDALGIPTFKGVPSIVILRPQRRK